MKILFVSDIHLNLRKNKEFEKNRFGQLFSFIDNYEADMLILGGDIFDLPNPNLDELALFYDVVGKVSKKKNVIVYSGNHEDLSKTECVFTKIPQVGFKYYDITYEPISFKKFHLFFVAHHKINEIKKLEHLNGFNILFSHIRCSIGMVKQEINLSHISKQFDEVILGDIHIPYDPYPNIHYCGSPYTIQYDLPRTTGIFEIEIGKEFTRKFVKTDFLPQKVKLNLTAREYLEIFNSLNPQNLYKIYVSGSYTDFENLPKLSNINLVFENVIDKQELQETADELIDSGRVDIYSMLFDLVKQSEDFSDNILDKGKELFDMIRKYE